MTGVEIQWICLVRQWKKVGLLFPITFNCLAMGRHVNTHATFQLLLERKVISWVKVQYAIIIIILSTSFPSLFPLGSVIAPFKSVRDSQPFDVGQLSQPTGFKNDSASSLRYCSHSTSMPDSGHIMMTEYTFSAKCWSV